ncbi:uncharacterized protein Eint_081020 [Encephalitozoon intestinalis ATCC 50506]|uniref:Uncharacterized protein n=1 Tax=Encephalitozoon intestinalis (strain ATCC 50506) TaxID=876142 RepID=E0S8Q1_ENCIT|nr:uncharacterized protein Eint_081020 [Encephalitozoon intestinalis ATCC 50506]ADM12034.2 hypothetical protein Eint_081020 [Encephalitozoon intestinalis ATCC 50506]UTX45822.1 hypothetical protein GPK93_08g14010 [Encephalitozoon intestinalis]
MDRENYLKLEKAIRKGEHLESLSVLRTILDRVVGDISETCPKEDLELLSKSIQHQRLVYEKAVSLYEGMQVENMEEDVLIRCLEDFNRSLQEYYALPGNSKPQDSEEEKDKL